MVGFASNAGAAVFSNKMQKSPSLPFDAVGRRAPPTEAPTKRAMLAESKSAPQLNAHKKLGAIPVGRKNPSFDIALPPPSKVPVAYAKLATVAPSIIERMLEAVRLQAGAICEIHPHTHGPVERAASRRAQGGWEVVRVCVCFASDDTSREAAALAAFVWPELRARCAARRLHLLIVEPRQGWPHAPPAACLQQL